MDDLLQPVVVDPVSQPFWDGASDGVLRVQACGACGRLRFPPRPMCPHCQSLDVRWEAMSGRGTIYSFVIPHPPLLPAYAALAPYNVALVALDEDPTIRLVGNVVTGEDAAINSVDPASLAMDLPVRAVFQRGASADDLAILRWVLQ